MLAFELLQAMRVVLPKCRITLRLSDDGATLIVGICDPEPRLFYDAALEPAAMTRAPMNIAEEIGVLYAAHLKQKSEVTA